VTSSRRTPTALANEALVIANKALALIAEHERTCGLRWEGVHQELRMIREQTRAHAQRWEKLAWFVVCTIGVGVMAIVIDRLL